MGWTSPKTWAAELLTLTDLNTHLKDNEIYLFSGRPGQFIKRDNGANYTTTSATFTPVDNTNLVSTRTINSGKVILVFIGVVNTTGGNTFWDFDIDGVRYGSAGADGLAIGLFGKNTVVMIAPVEGLSVGSHTFKVVWKVTSGQTGTLYSGNGTGTEDFIPCLAVIEVG